MGTRNDVEVETLRALLDETAERNARAVTYRVMDDAIRLRRVSVEDLERVPAHSCSLLKGRVSDSRRLEEFSKLADGVAGSGSVLASFKAQIGDLPGALKEYERLAQSRELSALEQFLYFKCSLARRDRKKLSNVAFSELLRLGESVPEVGYEILAYHAFLDDREGYRRVAAELNLSRVHVEALEAARWETRLELERDELWGGEKDSRLGDRTAFTVIGTRCSGGGAVQDFLADAPEVASSRGEYVVSSGYFGLMSLLRNGGGSFWLHEFLRYHLFGFSIPLNRTQSRVIRQPRADLRNGVAGCVTNAVLEWVGRPSISWRDLSSLLERSWRCYCGGRRGLMLRKMYSGGNLSLVWKGVCVDTVVAWRDPRDQYADQVAKGWLEAGDVSSFIENYKEKVSDLASGVNELRSRGHRVVDVSYEEFVTSRRYREGVVDRLGLDVEGWASDRFRAEESRKNIGIWRKVCSDDEVRRIERAVPELVDAGSKSVIW